MSRASKQMALCGLLCALAVTVMLLGTLIPAATYCCPVLASLTLSAARERVQTRLLWTMYAAISLLSLLLAPDKEAAMIFLVLGYYPIIRPALQRKSRVVRLILKAALYCAAVCTAYALLLFVLRPAELLAEFDAMQRALLPVLLLLGAATFFLYDLALGVLERRLASKRKGERK